MILIKVGSGAELARFSLRSRGGEKDAAHVSEPLEICLKRSEGADAIRALPKHPNRWIGYAVAGAALAAASAAFACTVSAVKPAGSLAAMSARILRSSPLPAFFRPSIRVE